MHSNQIIQNFQAAMVEHGITPPQQIISDGKLYRFHVQGDKKGSKNGYYLLFMNNISCGVFGSWKAGITHKWCSKKHRYMSNWEYAEYKRQIEEAKRQHAAVRAKEQADAARLAEHIFSGCLFANPNHRYLVHKRIKPFYARQQGSNLVLPVINFNGEFSSLQYITSDGGKWFLSNGVITGHFIPIQHQLIASRKILICEGFSTGGALAQKYPDACVIAACNAGNLKAVAVNIRQQLPTSEIIIGADIDPVGLHKAREAARAVKAIIIKPKFPPGFNKKLTDFNDLYCLSARGAQL
ncbi:MAG: toprim domain-containing protein [Gammaproteobacteria bacterium]|nr:toprim domain-containing protein [Gammaproteobacteria bacterium]